MYTYCIEREGEILSLYLFIVSFALILALFSFLYSSCSYITIARESKEAKRAIVNCSKTKHKRSKMTIQKTNSREERYQREREQ